MASPTSNDSPADVLVVFGITGDLAKVMTFHSLYRLEQRGLLGCPIVGVAVDDWTIDQLVQRARDSIVGTGEQLDEEVFERFADRLSYVQGDFGDAAAYERVAEAISGAESPVFYLEIPPFLFGRVVQGLAEAGLAKNARIVVEKPFGHDRESARETRSRARASRSTRRSSSASPRGCRTSRATSPTTRPTSASPRRSTARRSQSSTSRSRRSCSDESSRASPTRA